MALAAYHSAAFNKQSGLSVAGSAQVEVRKESDGTLAALKQDRAGSLAESNPLTADASGRFSFYVAADSEGFQIKVTDSDGNTLTLNNVPIGLLQYKDTQNILQDADGDTYWEVEESADEDIARLYIAGTQEVRVDATGVVILNGGSDVAGDGPFHIGAGLAGAVTARTDGNDIIIEAADNAGLTLLSGTANRVWFGDAANGNNKGLIECRPGTPSLGFGVNATIGIQIKTNEIVLNEQGSDTNIRMEGGTVMDLFFLDAGQENIGLNTSAPDASAILDLVSTTKALGLPSMTTAQRDAISSPRDGLAIYNTTADTVDARANGAWVQLGGAGAQAGLIPLAGVDLNGSPTTTNLEFTSQIDGTYDIYKIFLEGIQPVTDDRVLECQFYIGGALKSGASDYGWSWYGAEDTSAISGQNGTDNLIEMVRNIGGGAVGNDAGYSLDAEITIWHPNNTALQPKITWSVFYRSANNNFTRIPMAWGQFNATGTAMDGIRFKWNSGGDFAAGTAKLYGVRNP